MPRVLGGWAFSHGRGTPVSHLVHLWVLRGFANKELVSSDRRVVSALREVRVKSVTSHLVHSASSESGGVFGDCNKDLNAQLSTNSAKRDLYYYEALPVPLLGHSFGGCAHMAAVMGRLGQDKPAFGWELEPFWPLLLYRVATLRMITQGPDLPCLHTMDARGPHSALCSPLSFRRLKNASLFVYFRTGYMC